MKSGKIILVALSLALVLSGCTRTVYVVVDYQGNVKETGKIYSFRSVTRSMTTI